MTKKNRGLHWLLPLAFAAPLILGAALLLCLYGQTALDLFLVALKMVVIA